MFASSLLLAALLTPVQSTEWLTLKGERSGESVRLRVLARMTHRAVPNPEGPFYHTYSGDVTLLGGRISMVLKHVEPKSIKEIKEDFDKEASRVASAMPTQFEWRKVEENGFRGEIRYLRSNDGTTRICELGFAPLAYVRFVIATGDMASRAEEIIEGASFASRGGSGNVYPFGFPRRWAYRVGEAEFEFPWPQEGHTTDHLGPDGTKEKITIQSFRHPDGQILRSHIESPKTYSATEASKRTYPTPVPIDRLYTIAKVDMVKFEGHSYVRSKGTSGGDQFLQEYVAWTGRTPQGALQTLIAYRKPGTKWPKATPMDPEAPGGPITDDAWPDTVGIRPRPLKDGDQTIWITSYEPGTVDAKNPDVVQYGDQEGVLMAAVTGATAEKLRAVTEPKDDGKPFGPYGDLRSNLAWGFVQYGDIAWSIFYQYDSPGYSSLQDRFYVNQKGRKFVIEQASQGAGPAQLKLIQERYASFKGSADRPFLKDGRQGINWIVPAADFRAKLGGVPHFFRLEDRKSVGRAGNLSSMINLQGGQLYVSVIDQSTQNPGSWHSDIVENYEGGRRGKETWGHTTVRGRKVSWYQSTLSTGMRLTSFFWDDIVKDGQYRGGIHIRMAKDLKPDAWIAAFEAVGFKSADGK